MAGTRGTATVCLLLAAALALTSFASGKAVHRGFIRAQDGRFVDQECRNFEFVGANAWRWIQIADPNGDYPLSTPGSELESTDYLTSGGKKINPVLWAIRELQKTNVTVVRMFGAGVTTEYSMIKTPGRAGADGETWPDGKYNWGAVTSLHKIVGWCRAHGIKMIISFIDNWSFADSKSALVWAAGNATGKAIDIDDFYSNEVVKDYYKNHVSFILNQLNPFTGLQLKDDPTIMAWNLLNEPRCNCAPQEVDMTTRLPTATGDPDTNCANIEKCFTNVQAWVKEMAAFVKSIAPKQMIGVGDEGFGTWINDADTDKVVGTNPGSWSPLTGDSFSLQSTRGIDYHSTHMWVDDWAVAPKLPDPYTGAIGAPANPTDFKFHQDFLAARAAQAASEGKPFVIEEFGKYISRPATDDAEIKALRDPWFQSVFDIAENSALSGGSIHGVIMWKYGVSPYHNITDKNWVTVSDSTWTDIISPLGKKFNARKQQVDNCRPASGSAQARGMGISQPTSSAMSGTVTTMANMGSHSRSLLDTSKVTYISRGAYMKAKEGGKPIKGMPDLLGVKRTTPCVRACNKEPKCDGFHYNEELDRCTFRQDIGQKAKFNSDGWQTFWQEDRYQDDD